MGTVGNTFYIHNVTQTYSSLSLPSSLSHKFAAEKDNNNMYNFSWIML